jgi:hypothetical protein
MQLPVRPLPLANIYVDGSTTTRTAAVIEFAILLLSLIGIRRASLHGDSHLARLLKSQGIAYFAMAFLIQVSVIVSDFGLPEPEVLSNLDLKGCGGGTY